MTLDIDGVGQLEDSARGPKRSVGANPAASVAAILSKSLNDEDSGFLRVGRGEYTLKASTGKAAPTDIPDTTTQDEASETGALRAFGMYWKRDAVIWRGRPKILGRQGLAATRINFANQIGCICSMTATG